MFKFLAKTAPFLTILITGISSNYASAQAEPGEIVEQIEQYTEQGRDNIEQVTNVNQLRDVSPTDWSYDAIKSLTERYNCISGFPDGTFQGNRPITRNEFAAGLNSCFEYIERSINVQKQEYLNKIIFQGGELRIREEDGSISEIIYDAKLFPEVPIANTIYNVSKLENQTILLEEKQFSPTTKFTAETVFSFFNTF